MITCVACDVESTLVALVGEFTMLSAKDILREAESLPIEERAILVDLLLRTMNQPDPGIDQKWAQVAS